MKLEKQQIPYIVVSGIITGLIPALILLAPDLAIIESPELSISVFEIKNNTEYITLENKTSNNLLRIADSKLFVILQNNGNGQAEQVTLSISPLKTEENVRVFRTDASSYSTELEDSTLNLIFERISPESYVYVTIEDSELSKSEKRIWLAYEKNTEEITIPESNVNLGITNMGPTGAGHALGASFLISLAFLFSIRYMVVIKAERIREQHLGILGIQLTKFWSKGFKIGIGIIIAGHFIIFSYIINTYTIPFEIFFPSEIDLQEYLIHYDGIRNENSDYSMLGIIMIMVYLFSFVFVSTVTPLPNVQWQLKLDSTKNLLVSDIISSLLPYDKISFDMKGTKAMKKKSNIFVIQDENKSIKGLMGKKELEKLPFWDQGKKIEQIIKEKLDFPKWEQTNNVRNNFIIIHDKDDIEKIKEKMERHQVRYSIVMSMPDNIEGILDYELIFEKK